MQTLTDMTLPHQPRARLTPAGYAFVANLVLWLALILAVVL